MPKPPTLPRAYWSILPALLLLALGLRIYHLDARGFVVDEFTTVHSIRLSFPDMVMERLSEGHLPLYFLILKAWTLLFGGGATAILSLSVLFGVLSLAYIFLIARHAWGLECALWCLLFGAIHQEAIFSSQFARPYAALLLAAAASIHALMHGLESGKRGWWMQYFIWTVAGVLIHVSFLFVFLAQITTIAVWLALSRRWRGDWALATAIPAAAIAIMLAVLKHYNHSGYIARDSHWAALNQLKDGEGIYLGWIDKGLSNPWKSIGVAVIVGLIALAYLQSRRQPLRQARDAAAPPVPMFALLLTWTWAVPLGLCLMAVVAGGAMTEPRYYIVGTGGACLTMALGLSYLQRPARRYTLATLCTLLLAATTIAWSHEEGNGLREGFHYLAPHVGTPEPIIIRTAEAATISDFYGVEGPNVYAYVPQMDDAVRKALTQAADAGAGFWLVKLQYGKEKFPISQNLMSLVNARFRLEAEKIFSNTHVYHYVSSRVQN